MVRGLNEGPERGGVPEVRDLLGLLSFAAAAGMASYLLTKRRRQDQREREELRKSEELFRALFEEAPVAYHEIDTRGVVLRVNRAECALLGIETSEMLGKPIWKFVAPEEQEASREAIRQKISGETPLVPFQRPYLRRDGACLTLEIHDNLIRDRKGTMVGIRSALLDVTERRRAEEALRASQDRLAGILQLCEEAVISVDETQRIRLFNRGAEKIFGYASGEVLGQPLDMLLPARFREAHRQHIRGFTPSPEGARTMRGRPEVAGRRKDGSEFPAEASISKLELRGEKILTVMLRDITERQRMEAALQGERDFVSAVLDTAGALVVVLDAEGRIERFNRACERITGYSLEEVRGKPFWDLFLTPEEAAPVRAVFQKLLAGDFPSHYENHWVAKDGSRRRIAWSNTVLLNSKDAVEHVIATGIDITDRQRAEEALAEEVNLLHTMMDTWPDYIFVKDTQSRFVLSNLAQRRVLGATTLDEVVGKIDFDFFPEDLAAKYYADEQAVIRSGQPIFEVEEPVIERSGERKLLSTTKVPWRDSSGKVVGIVGMSRDITERKRAEALLQASEQRYRKLFENASDIVYTHDLRGRFTSINRAADNLTGYAPEEMLQMTIAQIIAPEHLERARQMTAGKIAGEKSTTYELELACKGGGRLPIEVSSTIIYQGGQPFEVLGIARDITARKQLEKQLIAAREVALEAARIKSEFLANMSHEIRTPMNGVLGMMQLLLHTSFTPEQRDCAESVMRSAEALLRVINDILDFSKMEAGKLQLERLPFDLSAIVEDVASLLALPAGAKGLELACLVYPETPRLVCGDPGRLRQVLTNLVGNAVKFTDRGEVIVRVELVSEDAGLATVRFTVEDTGAGMAPEQLPRLFESFVQGDASTTRKHGGTGLGLAISKQLVEMMGGEIGAESAPGRGSTFWFTAVFEQQPESSIGGPGAPAPLEGLAVLVADDNATRRAILRCYLQSWGCGSVEVSTGREAMETLRGAAAGGNHFRLALLGNHAPELDGFATAQAIKSDPLIRDTILVCLESASMRGDCAPPGEPEEVFAGCLTKPIRQSQLYDMIVRVLNGSGEQTGQPGAPQKPAHFYGPEERRHHPVPRRVLVVEDNEVNQKVALRLLQRAGYFADLASNGKQAVEAVSGQQYDLVLMDVQMPVMDGFEATAEIRRRESAGRHTPIVAMTANAMAGDRERCLAAGMDDYLSKPIRLEELRRVLALWLGGGEEKGSTGQSHVPQQYAEPVLNQ